MNNLPRTKLYNKGRLVAPRKTVWGCCTLSRILWFVLYFDKFVLRKLVETVGHRFDKKTTKILAFYNII